MKIWNKKKFDLKYTTKQLKSQKIAATSEKAKASKANDEIKNEL